LEIDIGTIIIKFVMRKSRRILCNSASTNYVQ